MKTFTFRNNDNCAFNVWHYNKERAIAITVIDTETDEEIETLTVLDDADYDVGFTRIYNGNVTGDEIFGYKTGAEVLQDLGIVEKVWETYEIDEDGINVIPVAECTIDLYKLKEYSKNWDYWEFEEE